VRAARSNATPAARPQASPPAAAPQADEANSVEFF